MRDCRCIDPLRHKAQGADPAAPGTGDKPDLRRKFNIEVAYESQIFIAFGTVRDLDHNRCSSRNRCFPYL